MPEKIKPALTVDELIEFLQEIQAKGQGSSKVAIQYDAGRATLGSHPSTGIQAVHSGFDWDAGKSFLQTEIQLGLSTPELLELGKKADELAIKVYQLEKILNKRPPTTRDSNVTNDSN